MNTEGKIMLSGNGDYGYTLTGLDTTIEYYDSYYGKTYGLGIKAGYGFFSNGVAYTGIELQQRKLVVKYDDGTESWKEHYTQKYLDIPLAYKFIFNIMYIDCGAYYGLRIGDMKYKETGDYNYSDTIDKKYTRNDYGLLFGLGGIVQLNETSGIDIGLKTKIGLAWVVDAPNFKLNCLSLILTLGYLTVF